MKGSLMDTKNNTIAFVTDDGKSISAHFGRALYYEVVTVQDGEVAERKRLNKDGHHTFGPDTHEHHSEGHEHNHDHKHATMIAPLAGVNVLIARGMGMGAQQHLLASGIQPILTDAHTIDEAIEQFVAGVLVDNPRRLHNHGPHHQH
jgi:predicted Fe-Mo cluster-binding NifX family protein